MWRAPRRVRRATRDVDLAASAIDGDTEAVRRSVVEVAAIELNDGVVFDIASTSAVPIRDDDHYGGVRVSLAGFLSTAHLHIHVDVNIGDPIWPPPIAVSLPRLLGGDPLVVVGYPIAMVLAEKIVTAIQRGTANTRWRDFVDIARLADSTPPDPVVLRGAIERVAKHREVTLRPLAAALDGFAPLAQARWVAWRRKQRLADVTPEAFDELLDRVIEIADAARAGEP